MVYWGSLNEFTDRFAVESNRTKIKRTPQPFIRTKSNANQKEKKQKTVQKFNEAL